jgi:type I restriction enzyme, S subunit
MRADWQRLPFDVVIGDESGGNTKTPQGEFLPQGRFAVVDQGKDLIAGYVNDASRLCRSQLPVIVFGDHTRCFKYVDFPFCMGADGVKVLRPKIDAEVKYLYHYLRQLRLTEGCYDRHFKYLKRTEIVLPPVREQRRIAEVLDWAEALRAERRAALAQLDTLTQSIFLELFGDPVTNRKGFPISQLGNVCDVRDGTHESPKYVPDGGYPLVTSKNLSGGVVDLTDVSYISEADYVQINKRSKVDPGDIIMPMIGTIGSPVLVDHEPRYAIKNVALIKFTKSSPSAVFVRHLLSCHYFDHIVGQKNRGGTQKFVSLGDLRSFPIPLPSVELQGQFARLVAVVEKLKTAHHTSLAELDALFAALQHRAFRGEL